MRPILLPHFNWYFSPCTLFFIYNILYLLYEAGYIAVEIITQQIIRRQKLFKLWWKEVIFNIVSIILIEKKKHFAKRLPINQNLIRSTFFPRVPLRVQTVAESTT